MLSARVGSLPTLKKIIPAKELAVSLETVKKHLRIDLINTDEDTLLEGLIRAATEYVESYCRISIIETRWRLSLSSFPDSGEPIELPRRPLVTSIGGADSRDYVLYVHGARPNPDGFLQIDGTDYLMIAPRLTTGVDVAGDLPSPQVRIHDFDDNGKPVQTLWNPTDEHYLAFDGNPPTVTVYGSGAAWQDTTTERGYPLEIEWTAGFGRDAESTPHDLKVAICLLVGHYYLNRETTSTTAGMPIPYGVSTLLMLHESGELV